MTHVGAEEKGSVIFGVRASAPGRRATLDEGGASWHSLSNRGVAAWTATSRSPSVDRAFAPRSSRGLTTFMTMAYILFLNPLILPSGPDRDGTTLAARGPVLTVTALSWWLMTIADGPLFELSLCDRWPDLA